MTPHLLSAADWQGWPGEFVALWTDAGHAYALYAPGALCAVALVNGAYPALSPRHLGAAWFERLAHDLYGHQAIGAADTRPAIQQFRDAAGRAAWPEFAAAPGAGAHAITIGPVRPGIAEPAHLHFTVRGETVPRLETRLGYSHKGLTALIRGKSPRLAARFAARVCGDATVAHSLAFAHAAEAALELTPPPRAVYLRAVMAELERIASHADDLGTIAGLAGFAGMAARLGAARETVRAAAGDAFGHRLMMDIVIPGGVATDLRTGGATALSAALAGIERELPGWRKILATDMLWQDRLTGIGAISLSIPPRAPGPAGRAAGGGVDARQSPGYAPYETLGLHIPAAAGGDVAARAQIRLAELEESIRLIHRLLHDLPEGAIAIAPPAGGGMGLGVAESFRGPVWVWLSVSAGAIADVFIADPSALLFPLLEHAATGADFADFPLVLASINPSPAGVDL